MDNKRLKSWGDQYEEMPKNDLWPVIQKKMAKRQKNKPSKLIALIVSVAALLIFGMVYFTGIQPWQSGRTDGSFAFHVEQKPLYMEDLSKEVSPSGYYSAQRISGLKEAYQRFGMSTLSNSLR